MSQISDTSSISQKPARHEQYWNWKPPRPAESNPLFLFPINAKAILKWYVDSWKPLSEYAFFFALAWLSWLAFQPELLSGTATSSTVLQLSVPVLFRNLAYTILLAGGFHYYFYVRMAQGSETKFDTRTPTEHNKRFLFGKQLHDNIFWTLASGVPIWSAYEAGVLWAQHTGMAPLHQWADGQIWFVAWFFLIPFWLSLHFYLGHRLLHWKPLYRISHSVHHRNICTGPWSGISMHPIEHLIYFSTFLIHLVIPSHPVHIFFHCYCIGLSPIFGHVGFESLVIRGKVKMTIGHYHHQLHHRYFECNYGAAELPCDVWFGTYDDGSAEARERLSRRRESV
ncbi:MAG: sterol desaturase family protein [Pseudomonadales bacterium]